MRAKPESLHAPDHTFRWKQNDGSQCFDLPFLPIAVPAVAAVAIVDGTASCLCSVVNTLLAGILGTVLFAVILLAVDVAATGVIGSILVGLLVFFFSLTLTSTACLVRQRFSC